MADWSNLTIPELRSRLTEADVPIPTSFVKKAELVEICKRNLGPYVEVEGEEHGKVAKRTPKLARSVTPVLSEPQNSDEESKPKPKKRGRTPKRASKQLSERTDLSEQSNKKDIDERTDKFGKKEEKKEEQKEEQKNSQKTKVRRSMRLKDDTSESSVASVERPTAKRGRRRTGLKAEMMKIEEASHESSSPAEPQEEKTEEKEENDENAWKPVVARRSTPVKEALIAEALVAAAPEESEGSVTPRPAKRRSLGGKNLGSILGPDGAPINWEKEASSEKLKTPVEPQEKEEEKEEEVEEEEDEDEEIKDEKKGTDQISSWQMYLTIVVLVLAVVAGVVFYKTTIIGVPYCDSFQSPETLNLVPGSCIACPNNAICKNNVVECNDPYILVSSECRLI